MSTEKETRRKLANTEAIFKLVQVAWHALMSAPSSSTTSLLVRCHGRDRSYRKTIFRDNPIRVGIEVSHFRVLFIVHVLWCTLPSAANHRMCKFPPRIMGVREDSDGGRVEVSISLPSGNYMWR